MLKFLSIFIFTLLTISPVFGSIIVPADVVEGQDTERNFVGRKGHFEKTANGVNGYDDGSAATPVDGTGGATITTTCTRTTTTPLDGDGSLIITKDAADRRGEGCSLDFTIPSAMKAKVLQIEFDYQVASGTFAAGSSSTNSDVIAYIYDVTNSTLIEPSSIKLLTSSTTIPDRFVANFQTSATGTNYRLMFHISTTSSSAWVLEVDSVKIKPSKYTYGTPITDWVSYTPTGGWTGTAVYNGKWRRVGDSMEVVAQVLCSGGAPTGGNLTFNLPSGYTIDTAKLPTDTSRYGLGEAVYLDTGTQTYRGNVFYNSTTSVIGNVFNASSTYATDGVVTLTVPFTFGNLDLATVQYRVPITGWSSSAQVSDSFDSRLISVSANNQAPLGTLGAAFNVTRFQTIANDYTASYSTATGLFTCPTAGQYRASATLDITHSGIAAGQLVAVALRKNGSTTFASQFLAAATGGGSEYMPSASGTIYCNAGDTIGVYSYSSGTTPSYTVNYIGSTFSIEKLQSPTTISATEVVAAEYNTTAAQTLTGSYAVNDILFTNKVVDTHNSYNTSTGIFTCPVAGIYEISARIGIASRAWATSDDGYITIYKGSTEIAQRVEQVDAAVTRFVPMQITPLKVNCNAGDTLKVGHIHGPAGSWTLASTGTDRTSNISIKRLK